MLKYPGANNAMKKTSYLFDLSCSSCGKSFDSRTVQTFCTDCNAPLLANYSLTEIKNKLDREELRTRPKGMWRWFELLPVLDEVIAQDASLGEGDTPLLKVVRIGNELKFHHVYIKEEGQNPTGSFKARGLAAAVIKAWELGIRKIVIPSAGNAGGALAAYSARLGIEPLVFMPRNSPFANVEETRVMGAYVEMVDGLINDAGKLAHEASLAQGWFNISTFKEPYRVEGKKIMGYEIAEALSWKLPNVIIYPTGGGTGLVGMWKAFQEIEKLGWLESNTMPKLVAVQAEGCAPIVKAFQAGDSQCELWHGAHTIATGLCVPLSFADKLVLKYIRESSGIAISVSDSEIIEAQLQLAHKEGVFSCPEGAATLAAFYKLVNRGFINRDDIVVLFNTGSGLKYLNL
jgi:threonine synthase